MIKKLVGDRKFYTMVLGVVIPIMIQNFITNFVNMLDNLMVGAVGTEQMSGVSIVNQLVFVVNLAIFGAVSGAGIFTSQFYGKSNDEGIRYTVRYKLISLVAISVASVALLLGFGDKLINMFLHDGSYTCDLELTFNYAMDYMKICVIGFLPYALSQLYSSTLRETGETFVPMAVGFVAVVVNCVFNYLLIFGKFGFPEMGVEGAALATVTARFVEFIVIMIYSKLKSEKHTYFKGAFKSLYMPKKLAVDISLKGLPILFNEFLWAAGISLLSMSYSFHGLDVVAGYSISSTVINLFNIAFLSMGVGIGIVVGKYLGANEFEEAVDADTKMIAFSVFLSVVVALIVIFIGSYIPNLYNTSQSSKELAAYFIRTAAMFMPVNAFVNALYFTLRSGGKTFVTFLFDSVFVCVITVPVAMVLSLCTSLSIWAIYPMVLSVDIIRIVVGTYLVKSKTWVNNIVEDN